MDSKLENLRSIQYFHFYKGDITRMADWEEALGDLPPEVSQALGDVARAQRTLDALNEKLKTLLDAEIDKLED